ncbi:MAG TPA: PBP1A family penicillin-binding protein [Bryobacteraceae bacterium]|nr:PBP1A family penicillin-binding protein [Bryobacteraceae bacterium]
MPVKVQVPKRNSGLVRLLVHPAGKIILAIVVMGISLGLIVFTYYYAKYSNMIAGKLTAGPFANTSMLYAAPQVVMVGDEASPQEIAAELRRAGYSESRNNVMGHYAITADGLEVYPGPDSYFKRDEAVIKFAKGRVSQIIALGDNTDRTQYALEPEMISNLFDKNREKQRLIRFDDIPPLLVHAVISAEDKRFFQHSGFDPIRILKSAYVDVKEHHNAQGASTLSMQLAGMLFLNRNERTWKRKIPEVLITLDLERKLSKEKIFEYYCNEVPLGRRGSFGIRGFGEAAQAYFNKDVKSLTLPEAATLAGLIQQPSFINPYRWPDRAKQRRNVVLKLMYDNQYISLEDYNAAVAAPLVVSKHDFESTDAPYFIDIVNDTLTDKFPDYDFQANGYRIYTTLDPALQRDAAEAVRIGMEEVDKRIAHRKKKDPNYPDPQCALIAVDPQTGEIKALVGGRNYGMSQLDHALAKRQPGSSFKPFVYASALNTGLSGGSTILTPASLVNDEPKTFWYDDKPYTPHNFENEVHGTITMREALAYSSNVAAVTFAEETGYGVVVDLARRAGLNMSIKPTPAVALGSYEVTPLEIAGAYTTFANHGLVSKPAFISSIGDQHGRLIYENKPDRKQILDPRVAFLLDSLMQEVVNNPHGTGAGIHSRGINFPVAGKTGTSDHDGWFAGFSSKLICIVWVGFDDNRDLNLQGAHSALPIWAEFMKRAHEHREYKNVAEFEPPTGITSVQIDPQSGMLATAACPSVRTEYFIEGTQPLQTCPLHGGGATQVASWDTSQPPAHPASPSVAPIAPGQDARLRPARQQTAQATPPAPDTPAPNAAPEQKKHKGFLGRIRDIFR